MCPCISSKSKYAICLQYESELMVPSISERINYCFDAYELCPLFLGFKEINNPIAVNGFHEISI